MPIIIVNGQNINIGPGVNLYGANLTGANLNGANLSNASLKFVNLTNANLTGANLTGADLFAATLTSAKLNSANLTGANLNSATLTNTNLTGANLTGADIPSIDFSSATLTGVISGNTENDGYITLPYNWNFITTRTSNTTNYYARFGYLIGPGANLTNANFNSANLAGMNLAGANLTNANLNAAKLMGANLMGAILTGAGISSTDFTDAILTNANLSSVRFVNATNLTRAILTGANLTSASMVYPGLLGPVLTGVISGSITGNPVLPSGWKLTNNGYLIGRGANLYGAHLNGEDLHGRDLSGANFSSADLSGADLSGANFTGANLSGANLTVANLTGATLNSANLYLANLSDATLTDANLSRATLIFAKVSRANLSNATLTGADMTDADLFLTKLPGAHLMNVNFTRAGLRSAVLNGAVLTRANLNSVELYDTNLTNANLTGADLTAVNLMYANLTGATLTGVISSNISGTPSQLPDGWQLTSGVLSLIPPATTDAISTLQNQLSGQTDSSVVATAQLQLGSSINQSILNNSLSPTAVTTSLLADTTNGLSTLVFVINSLKQNGDTGTAAAAAILGQVANANPTGLTARLTSQQTSAIFSTMQHPPSPGTLPSGFTLQLKVPSGNNTIIFDNNNALNLLVTGRTYDIRYNGQITNQLTYKGNGQCQIGFTVYNTGDVMTISAPGVIPQVKVPFYAAGTITTGAAFTDPPANNIPCFVAGTLIRTPAGEKAVELLRNGDIVVTADGRSVPIKVYSTTLNKTNKGTAPYLVPAHSFGRNSPPANLCLSPLHAFQIKKGLWMNSLYANNKAVQQYAVGEAITYYHVECPNFFRDNLLANGCVVESFAGRQVANPKNIYTFNSRLGGFTRATKEIKTKTVAK